MNIEQVNPQSLGDLDIALLHDVAKEGFGRDVGDVTPHILGAHDFLIARDSKNYLGFCSILNLSNVQFLWGVVTSIPGKGIGSALLTEMFRLAEKKGYLYFALNTENPCMFRGIQKRVRNIHPNPYERVLSLERQQFAQRIMNERGVRTDVSEMGVLKNYYPLCLYPQIPSLNELDQDHRNINRWFSDSLMITGGQTCNAFVFHGEI